MTHRPISDLDERKRDQTGHGEGVRDMFDRIAPTYDVANRVMSAGVDVRWRKRAVRELGEIPKGALLDSCAGTLDLTALLVAKFPERRVVAADFSSEMLERGKNKAPAAERVQADAMKLPFADAEFAAMICGFGMRNLSDTKAGIREAFRVLAPGGVFVTLEFFRPIAWYSRAFHGAYANAVLPIAGGALSGDASAYRYLARSMKGFLSRDEYEIGLREAGFSEVRGHDLLLGIASIVRAEK
ncbi:MAG: ubiquinone/menaquinone biosynthesis methyltransferase, partial [Polyangiaceae bacterium]